MTIPQQTPEGAPRPIVSPPFPFSAIVGQEDLRLALILNALDPTIGGVLLRGEKGTGKSTAVRSLARLFPVQEGGEVAPFVDLPLNATEDMVVGSIDFERTIRDGKRTFRPGLLARAHGGFLYVDEVNLLDDHLVDALLDAAASGYNRVEREGVSYSHPARFSLIGSMNPEEGSIRPQLLDRFGFCVSVGAEEDPEIRVALLERRERYDRDPVGFLEEFREQERESSARLHRAQGLARHVSVPARLRLVIAATCREKNVAGHRADLVWERGAAALAAYEDRDTVSEDDLRRVAPFVFAHRERAHLPAPAPEEAEPEAEPSEAEEEQDHQVEPAETPPKPDHEHARPEADRPEDGSEEPRQDEPPDRNEETEEQVFAPTDPFQVRRIEVPTDRVVRDGGGRRSRSRTRGKHGRYVRATSRRTGGDIAFDATVRAAAPFQRVRRREGVSLVVTDRDIHEKVRERRVGSLFLFVVDASGSMGAQRRMEATKGAVLSLLVDAYQKRDRVAMTVFRRDHAETVLPPTSSIDRAERLLRELPVGGTTPLAAGLYEGHRVVSSYLAANPTSQVVTLIVTDGRANAPAGTKPLAEAHRVAAAMSQDLRVRYIVIDTEANRFPRFGLAEDLAVALNAEHYRTEDLRADELASVVRH